MTWANCVTNCFQQFFHFLSKFIASKNASVLKAGSEKKLLDFAEKCPWLQARRQQLPALKVNWSSAVHIHFVAATVMDQYFSWTIPGLTMIFTD